MIRLLGVVGLVSRDLVDGAPPRVGGAAFHSARALAALGHPAVVATKFAEADRRLAAPLHALGLPVAWRPASRTITFRIENDEAGERRMAIEELGEAWTPEEARGWLAEYLARVDWLHAGALTRADFPAETLESLARGRVLSLDGQGLVRPARTGPLELDADFDPEVLRHVDVLKLSQAEAEALGLGFDERSLASLGVAEVVVTLGGRGSIVYADGIAEYVPARRLEGVDPTGAGDMFAAAYLASRRGGHAPTSAARRATALVYGMLSRCVVR